jgi:hypothetical protein
MLAQDVLDAVKENPRRAVETRIRAGLYFFLGRVWFEKSMSIGSGKDLPSWLDEPTRMLIIQATLLAMITLGLLGWRWTHGWRRQSRLATIAAVFVPLPYILSHAGNYWGPRLPLDGVLLCYTAVAVTCMIPKIGGKLAAGARG